MHILMVDGCQIACSKGFCCKGHSRKTGPWFVASLYNLALCQAIVIVLKFPFLHQRPIPAIPKPLLTVLKHLSWPGPIDPQWQWFLGGGGGGGGGEEEREAYVVCIVSIWSKQAYILLGGCQGLDRENSSALSGFLPPSCLLVHVGRESCEGQLPASFSHIRMRLSFWCVWWANTANQVEATHSLVCLRQRAMALQAAGLILQEWADRLQTEHAYSAVRCWL